MEGRAEEEGREEEGRDGGERRGGGKKGAGGKRRKKDKEDGVSSGKFRYVFCL